MFRKASLCVILGISYGVHLWFALHKAFFFWKTSQRNQSMSFSSSIPSKIYLLLATLWLFFFSFLFLFFFSSRPSSCYPNGNLSSTTLNISRNVLAIKVRKKRLIGDPFFVVNKFNQCQFWSTTLLNMANEWQQYTLHSGYSHVHNLKKP